VLLSGEGTSLRRTRPPALSHTAVYLRDVENGTSENYLAALSQHLKEVPEPPPSNFAEHDWPG
jgi:hypothetical protein